MLSSDNYQLVIEKFLKSLQDGTLKPNDKIYSENQLARILNIPRAQVREVYAALSLLGVLYGQQGKGTFLGNGDLSQSSNILYLMTLAAGENFEDTLAVRRILEIGSHLVEIREADLIGGLDLIVQLCQGRQRQQQKRRQKQGQLFHRAFSFIWNSVISLYNPHDLLTSPKRIYTCNKSHGQPESPPCEMQSEERVYAYHQPSRMVASQTFSTRFS